MKNFIFFYRIMAKEKLYQHRILLAVFLGQIIAVFKWVQAKLIAPIIDISSNTGVDKNLILIILLLALLNIPVKYFHLTILRKFCENINAHYRRKMVNKLVRIPYGFFGETPQGEVINPIISDIQKFSQGLQGTVEWVSIPLSVVILTSLAFSIDMVLTLTLIAMAPLLIWVFQFARKKNKKIQAQIQEQEGKLSQNFLQFLQGQSSIRVYQLFAWVKMRFAETQCVFNHRQKKLIAIQEFVAPLTELLLVIIFSVILFVAQYRMSNFGLTPGAFVSFLAALALLNEVFRKNSQIAAQMGQAMGAFERISHFLSLPEESYSDHDHIEHKVSFGKIIQLQDVSLSINNRSILKHINLTLTPGKKIALIGKSGSGKSSLINLLLGLIPHSNGKMIIDDDISPPPAYYHRRSLFTFVGQRFFVFNQSLANNIFFEKEVDLHQLCSLLQNVGLAQVFPRPLEVQSLGQRGSTLSGGQAQRVAIARAFANQRDIIVLDEATSALDEESQTTIFEAFLRDPRLTVVMSAHRLELLKYFDEVIELSEGMIIKTQVKQGV